ncbi:DUF1402 family protein [Gellertiella hungarica]
MRYFLAILSIATATLCSSLEPAAAMTRVPPGNRHVEQPPIPGASVRRTRAGKTTFDDKYEKIRDLLATDEQLRSKIRETARAYGIDPIHIAGALVGEHTYNVDAYDRLQSYYVKAAAYAGNSFQFAYDGEKVDDFVSRPEFSSCASLHDSYRLWTCRETVWDTEFRGKSVGGKQYPNNRFSAVFFQPFFAGQTFGLGQVNPLTALKLSDLVHQRSGIEPLDVNDAAAVYDAIMDPDKSLAFVGAAIRQSIDDYKSIAGMDISSNPGITATLYNLGNTLQRAQALAARNRSGGNALPEENYYGWLINDKLEELKALF